LREKSSNAMLSWCPAVGAPAPGGNESRGGLLPVDHHIREAHEFKAKLLYSTATQGTGMELKVWGILHRDPGTYSPGRPR